MSHTHKNQHYINNIEGTVVIESPVHGYGLFATKDIEKNTLLCELSGQTVTKNEYEKIFKSDLFPKEAFIEKHHLGEDKILLTPFRTSYSFINHSGEVEHLVEKYEDRIIKVYAKINIKKNEEILSKYNLDKHIDILGGFNK
jgi:SET domain-containing protein